MAHLMNRESFSVTGTLRNWRRVVQDEAGGNGIRL